MSKTTNEPLEGEGLKAVSTSTWSEGGRPSRKARRFGVLFVLFGETEAPSRASEKVASAVVLPKSWREVPELHKQAQ